jgi:hypothetical protein
MTSSISYVLQYLVTAGPMLLVAAVGLLLTIVNWQKLGNAAVLATSGFGLHLLASLASLISSVFVAMQLNAGSAASIATTMRAIGIVNGLLHAVAMACLLAALLTPRTPAQ